MRLDFKLLTKIAMWSFIFALTLRPVVVSVQNGSLLSQSQAAQGLSSSDDAPALSSHEHALKKVAKQTPRSKNFLAPARPLSAACFSEAPSSQHPRTPARVPTRLNSLRI